MTNKQKTTIKQQIKNTEDLIFALDIGTRSVVGVVGYYEKDLFKVVGAEIYEHSSRAMLDGQIHDITKVAEVVSEVKNKLEQTLGVTLTKVAIAAAGRVLKTAQLKLEYDIEPGREITAELVGGLEVDAIQSAQIKLDNENVNEDKVPFYCVGYSVVNYYLNGYVISSLIGHKGKKIGVEILATFLPHIVVDSLYTVMSKVGLEVISLTLEPIAAISITIPKDLRLLNLVLVDIGAGTSDIAVTKDGSVVAYGMVPVAGDEITEKIATEFLVDFNTAEKIKISISSGTEIIKYTDILGKKNEISNRGALEVLQPVIDNLANNITEKILEFNLKAPNAVFLIGGGSQIPGLSEKIAQGLGLQPNRVAVRGRDVIQNIKTKLKKLSGPESITPFGIAMMAYTQRGQDFMSVTVNGEKVRLFNSKKLTVADALILTGYNPDMLIGRTGRPLNFKLNGKEMILRGEPGTSADIQVNKCPASLETQIKVGDVINVKPSQKGKDAIKCIIDYVKNPNGLHLTINDEAISVFPIVVANGEICSFSRNIVEGETIQIDEVLTLSDLSLKFNLCLEDKTVLVNDENKTLNYILQNNDNINYFDSSTDIMSEIAKLEVEINEGKKFTIESADVDEHTGFVISVNGEKIDLKENKSYIFVDIFSHINFDLTIPQGNIVLKLNGRPANFTDTIQPGDSIEIYWEKFKV